MASRLLIHTELEQYGQIVTTVIGDLDAVTAPRLAEQLRRSPVATDVFDLRFVSLMSAAGISVLIEAHRIQPCPVVASASVESVLDVCDLRDHFETTTPVRPPSLHRASFGVAVHDSDLRYIYVNDALAEINGLAAQAHYDQLPTELFDVSVDEITPVLNNVITTGSEHRMGVDGATPSDPTGSWDCTCRRSRYRQDDIMRTVVVATVETRMTPKNSAVDTYKQIGFTRRDAPSK